MMSPNSPLSPAMDDADLIALGLEAGLNDFVSLQHELRRIERDEGTYENNVDSSLSQNLNVPSIVVNFV